MADDKELQAKENYELVISALEARNWKFSRDDEKYSVSYGVNGDDISMSFRIDILRNSRAIRVLSWLPTKMKNKLVEGAIATLLINYKLADGSFDLNVEDGEIVFRQVAMYNQSVLSEEVINYLVDCSSYTVDEYNDKLDALAKGDMTIEEFIDYINGERVTSKTSD